MTRKDTTEQGMFATPIADTASRSSMEKPLAALLLLGAVLFAAAPIRADELLSAEANGYTWTYRVVGNTAEICNGFDAAVSPSPADAVTIPSTLGGKTVTSIGEWAFYDCGGLTDVTIPNSVTNIGRGAFYNCGGLTRATIPDSVTDIGGFAFYNCYELARVTIGNGVASIGESAFRLCSSLVTVTLGQGVTNIGNNAFSGCGDLTSINIPNDDNPAYSSVDGLLLTKDGETLVQGVNGHVTIPAGVTSIRAGAFDGCSGLTDVTIPIGVTDIGDQAFAGCGDLARVAIPDSVTRIGDGAFSDCRSLESVSIGAAVRSIGELAFAGCGSLAGVTLPNGVTTIEAEAFSGCGGLTSVTIPGSVTSIGDWAFYGCSSLSLALVPAALEDAVQYAEVFLDCAPALQIIYYSGSDIPFAMGGDANWTQEQDGSWKSGKIGDNQKTWIETTVSGMGLLSFAWKASSQSGRDKLYFYLDGVLQTHISGNKDWTESSYEISTEGLHTLRWLYKKDGSGSGGSDCAWVDSVTWTPGGTAPDGVTVDAGDGKTVTVPYAWLSQKTQRAATDTAANGRRVWECYVLGLDPEDARDFRITLFPMKADGTPDLGNIAFEPPRSEWNVRATPKVMGAATPDGPWNEVPTAGNAAYRFFKVKVTLP